MKRIILLFLISTQIQARIISLSPGITDILVHLNLQDKVVGTDQNYVLPDTEIVGNAFNIDLEKIFKLNSKVIYFEEIQNSRELEKLKASKRNIITLKLNSLENLKKSIKTISNQENVSSLNLLKSLEEIPKLELKKSITIVFGFEKKVSTITGAYTLQKKSLLGDLLVNSNIQLDSSASSYLTIENISKLKSKYVIVVSDQRKEFEVLRKQLNQLGKKKVLFIQKSSKDLFNGPSTLQLHKKIINLLRST